MSVFRIFSSSSNVLGRRLVHPRNVGKYEEQHRTVTNRVLAKLGIPLPPVRPMNPYLKFSKMFRPKITLEQPHLSSTEIVKVLAQKWQQYDPEKKKELQKLYFSEMDDYLEKFQSYKQTITPEQKNLIQDNKEKIKRSKELARLNEKKESLGRPKKPCTPFFLFLREKKIHRDKNTKYADWLNQISQEWEQLSELSKEKYLKEAQTNMAKYKSDIIAWEASMIRQGHIDVVRQTEKLDVETKKQSRKIK